MGGKRRKKRVNIGTQKERGTVAVRASRVPCAKKLYERGGLQERKNPED